MKDPLRPPRGAANMGGAGLARTGGENPSWELGEIVTYNSGTHSAAVRTHGGRPLQDVPQIKSTFGGYDHIPVGTTVVISWNLGFPAIIGCIDLPGPPQTAIPSPSLTGVEGVGSSDATQPTQGAANFKPPGAPTDMGSGDWAQVGSLGNHVAVLEGGVALLGSPAAQVQSMGPSGMLRLIARTFQQFTDFGQLSIENDQGKTSLILRAGSSQATQTGQDEQHWTIRLDLGATGDILDFRIQEPEGKLLFRLHAGSDGRVQIYGDGGVDISSGVSGTAQMRHDIAGSKATAVSGDVENAVQGNATVTVDGASTTSIGGAAVRSIAGDSTDFVGGDHAAGVSGNLSHTVAGKRQTQIGGDDSTEIDGASTTKAKKILMVDGTNVKLGKSAVQPAIRGFDLNAKVLAPISAAASVLLAGAAAASVTASVTPPGPVAMAPVALAALNAAVSSFASSVISAIASYSGSLSSKVKVE